MKLAIAHYATAADFECTQSGDPIYESAADMAEPIGVVLRNMSVKTINAVRDWAFKEIADMYGDELPPLLDWKADKIEDNYERWHLMTPDGTLVAVLVVREAQVIE